MTKDNPVDWTQVPQVTPRDVARWRARQRPSHPLAALWAVGLVLGLLLWLWTGEWRWAITGLAWLLVVACVGAAIDARAAHRVPTMDVGTFDGKRITGLPLTADVSRLWHDEPPLEAKVLGWLRKHHEGAQFDVIEVMAVVPFGDDYAGSTEDGFQSTFCVRVGCRTTDPSRPTLYLDVEGSDMESLWRHVIGGEE